MFDLLVTSESVQPAKPLLVIADLASHLLAMRVVDGIFMTSKIVWSREDSVTGLASHWVGASAAMRTRLSRERNVYRRLIGVGIAWSLGVIDLPVFLELCVRLEALIAAFGSTSVSTSVGLSTLRLLKLDLGLLFLLLLGLLHEETGCVHIRHGHRLEIRESGWQERQLWVGVV